MAMLTTMAAMTMVFRALLNGCGGSTCARCGPGPKSSDVSADSLTSLTLLTVEILAYCAHQHKLLKRPSKLDGCGESVFHRAGGELPLHSLEHHANSDYRQKRAGRNRAIAVLPVPWRRGFNRAPGVRSLERAV